jgi:hypothetical protein
MVTAIWGAAVVVIITDGVEAEGIITAGGIIATDFNLKEAAAVGGLFHVSLGIRPNFPHHAELPDPQGAPALLHCVAQGKADRRGLRLVRKRNPSRMLMTGCVSRKCSNVVWYLTARNLRWRDRREAHLSVFMKFG